MQNPASELGKKASSCRLDLQKKLPGKFQLPAGPVFPCGGLLGAHLQRARTTEGTICALANGAGHIGRDDCRIFFPPEII